MEYVIKLSPINRSNGYVDKNIISIETGDSIRFTTTEGYYKVYFVKPSTISIYTEDNKSSGVVSPDTEDEYIFSADPLPEVCEYIVIRTDVDQVDNKGQSKMTVKAIITRNG